jgi:2-dehydro-3-deoxyphosphogluconate aldolase/(4S)-4-hydroxy-2-oxoglutarate aldolase
VPRGHLPTPGALDAISSLRIEYGPEVVIGTGTVLSPEDVRRSAEAGAGFVVSPGFLPDVVAAAVAKGLGVLPGVLTPTEAVRASQSGATAVKLFPASTVGPAFIAALRAPLPDLPIVAVGGIGLDDVRPWVDVGAPLVDGDLTGLRDRASRFVAAAGGSAT